MSHPGAGLAWEPGLARESEGVLRNPTPLGFSLAGNWPVPCHFCSTFRPKREVSGLLKSPVSISEATQVTLTFRQRPSGAGLTWPAGGGSTKGWRDR